MWSSQKGPTEVSLTIRQAEVSSMCHLCSRTAQMFHSNHKQHWEYYFLKLHQFPYWYEELKKRYTNFLTQISVNIFSKSKDKKCQPGMVVYICNPSWGRRIAINLKTTWATEQDTVSRKRTTAERGSAPVWSQHWEAEAGWLLSSRPARSI